MRIQIDGFETKTQLQAIKKAIDHILENESSAEDAGTGVNPIPPTIQETPCTGQCESCKKDTTEVTVPVASIGTGDEITGDGIDPEPKDELDSSGLPWDARIHASSKAKVKSGAWKRRKGVDQATYESVVAELVGSPAPTTPDPATSPATPDPATVGFGDQSSSAVDQLTWEQVVQKVMNAKVNEQVMQAQIDAEAVNLGVDNFMSLVNRPDLWNQFLIAIGVS